MLANYTHLKSTLAKGQNPWTIMEPVETYVGDYYNDLRLSLTRLTSRMSSQDTLTMAF